MHRAYRTCPIGKLLDGDIIEIIIDLNRLEGSINFIGKGEERFSAAEGAAILAVRDPHPDLVTDPALPEDTRLWSAAIG
nr:hypothetical protein [Paenibacillus mendelii]